MTSTMSRDETPDWARPGRPLIQSELLKHLLGQRLEGVARWLYVYDQDVDHYEEDADGPTSLFFTSDKSVHFQPDTTGGGLLISKNQRPVYGESYQHRDVSGNAFWKSRVGQIVAGLKIFKSVHASPEYPLEFGVQFCFENGHFACLEYIDSEMRPDTLRIVEKPDQQDGEFRVLDISTRSSS